jgi:hypothetical protein
MKNRLRRDDANSTAQMVERETAHDAHVLMFGRNAQSEAGFCSGQDVFAWSDAAGCSLLAFARVQAHDVHDLHDVHDSQPRPQARQYGSKYPCFGQRCAFSTVST